MLASRSLTVSLRSQNSAANSHFGDRMFCRPYSAVVEGCLRHSSGGYGCMSFGRSTTVCRAKTCRITPISGFREICHWYVMGLERLRQVVHVKHSQTLITDFFKGSNVRHEEGGSSESVSSCECTGSSAPSISSSSSQSFLRTPPSRISPPWSFTSACSLSRVSETCMS